MTKAAKQLETFQGAIDWAVHQVKELVKELEKDKAELAVQNKILQTKVSELDFETAELEAENQKELIKDKAELASQNKVLEAKVSELQQMKAGLEAENQHLHKKTEEQEQCKTGLEEKVDMLQQENQQLQSMLDALQASDPMQSPHLSESMQPSTHRNILYSEEKQDKRLPVFQEPARGAQAVGSLVFGECFAVDFQIQQGQDLWLQIRGGDHANHWVLGCDSGTVNCADMTKYGCDKYCTRIDSSEYSGQDFPKKMYTEGFAGSSSSNVCLVSSSGGSFWRELNIEMLLRGIATAAVSEQAWGGAPTDWVARYAINCALFGQLGTPSQKDLLVTVKPTSRWRQYQAGCCRGPDLDTMRDDIGEAQHKECSWLKGMKEQLHIKWEEVEFLTGFAFLRTHCAWTREDCRSAANDQFVCVLEEFFARGVKEASEEELERAYWLWDEAFDGCAFEEAARATACAELQRLAKVTMDAWLEIPGTLRASGAAPLAWADLAASAAAASAVAVAASAATVAAMDGAGRLAAGGWHSALLDSGGSLHTWGDASKGQCSTPSLAPSESWVAVSAGSTHTVALTVGGMLHTWGSNQWGQCSAPSLGQGVRWAAVSAGPCHSLGLTATGALHAWGSNFNRQCNVPVLPAGERWAAASAGGSHSLGLTVGGVLHTWGSDGDGRCSKAPVLPQGEHWTAISAGAAHSLGLTAVGELRAWGADDFEQCSGVPRLGPGEHWVAISAGGRHSMGLTSAGTLCCWGHNEEGQCTVPAGERWLALSAGFRHSLGLTSAGVVRAWGKDDNGQVSRVP